LLQGAVGDGGSRVGGCDGVVVIVVVGSGGHRCGGTTCVSRANTHAKSAPVPLPLNRSHQTTISALQANSSDAGGNNVADGEGEEAPNGWTGLKGTKKCQELQQLGKCTFPIMKGKCCATCKTDSCPAHVVAAAEAANSNLPEEVAPGGAVGASARMKCQAFKKQGMCADSRVRGFCCVSCGDESCSVRTKRKKTYLNFGKLHERTCICITSCTCACCFVLSRAFTLARTFFSLYQHPYSSILSHPFTHARVAVMSTFSTYLRTPPTCKRTHGGNVTHAAGAARHRR
jgi:hypothetical protein